MQVPEQDEAQPQDASEPDFSFLDPFNTMSIQEIENRVTWSFLIANASKLVSEEELADMAVCLLGKEDAIKAVNLERRDIPLLSTQTGADRADELGGVLPACRFARVRTSICGVRLTVPSLRGWLGARRGSADCVGRSSGHYHSDHRPARYHGFFF